MNTLHKRQLTVLTNRLKLATSANEKQEIQKQIDAIRATSRANDIEVIEDGRKRIIKGKVRGSAPTAGQPLQRRLPVELQKKMLDEALKKNAL